MYHAVLNVVCFKTFSEKHKENELHRKYMLFGSPAETSHPTILPIKQISWFYLIYYEIKSGRECINKKKIK